LPSLLRNSPCATRNHLHFFKAGNISPDTANDWDNSNLGGTCFKDQMFHSFFVFTTCKKKKKVICPQVPCMAEELHHVQMFTKVVLLGILFSQFLEENSHVYFLLGFLGHSFKIGLESFFGFRVFAFKNKTKKSNMQQQQQKIRHLP